MKTKKKSNDTACLQEQDPILWFWLFMIGNVAGIILEGVWMLLKDGRWEYHTATIWGPFCLIYGIGAVMVTILSGLLQDAPGAVKFLAYTIACTVTEYLGSLFQEVCFGAASWDYSDQLLNVEGRVSLMMSVLWGALGFLFVRFFLPPLKKLIGRFRSRTGFVVTWILIVFMAVNTAATCLTIYRWAQRVNGIAPGGQIEAMLDRCYGDETMERLFPNLRFLAR